jgi:hypothetical protein
MGFRQAIDGWGLFSFFSAQDAAGDRRWGAPESVGSDRTWTVGRIGWPGFNVAAIAAALGSDWFRGLTPAAKHCRRIRG